MKNKSILKVLSLTLSLVLAFALFPAGRAEAFPGHEVLVAVDLSTLSGDSAAKLVPADSADVARILGNTDVCEETAALLQDENTTVVKAILHPNYSDITAVTELSDGRAVDVAGHAVVEGRGEFQFGSLTRPGRSMQYGFVQEDNSGLYRFYSTATLQKFSLISGGMARDTVLFINNKAYTFDANGYCDISDTSEIDPALKARYVRATYYEGLPETYPFPISNNNFVNLEHLFDFSHVSRYVAATCVEPGHVEYACKYCGAAVSYPGEDINPKAHAWGNWVDNKNGTETRTCKLCGTTETRSK